MDTIFTGLHAPAIIALLGLLGGIGIITKLFIDPLKKDIARIDSDLKALKAGQAQLEKGQGQLEKRMTRMDTDLKEIKDMLGRFLAKQG